MNNLPKVVAQQRRGRASNLRLLDRKSDALPLSHRALVLEKKSTGLGLEKKTSTLVLASTEKITPILHICSHLLADAKTTISTAVFIETSRCALFVDPLECRGRQL